MPLVMCVSAFHMTLEVVVGGGFLANDARTMELIVQHENGRLFGRCRYGLAVSSEDGPGKDDMGNSII